MNENADPTVRGDLEAALNRIVPEEWHHTLFEHVEEGPDDMTAHVKSTLLGCSLTVPVDPTGRMKTGMVAGRLPVRAQKRRRDGCRTREGGGDDPR